MTKTPENDIRDDAFEPIELGSAFEETRGGVRAEDEGNILPNTRQ